MKNGQHGIAILLVGLSLGCNCCRPHSRLGRRSTPVVPPAPQGSTQRVPANPNVGTPTSSTPVYPAGFNPNVPTGQPTTNVAPVNAVVPAGSVVVQTNNVAGQWAVFPTRSSGSNFVPQPVIANPNASAGPPPLVGQGQGQGAAGAGQGTASPLASASSAVPGSALALGFLSEYSSAGLKYHPKLNLKPEMAYAAPVPTTAGFDAGELRPPIRSGDAGTSAGTLPIPRNSATRVSDIKPLEPPVNRVPNELPMTPRAELGNPGKTGGELQPAAPAAPERKSAPRLDSRPAPKIGEEFVAPNKGNLNDRESPANKSELPSPLSPAKKLIAPPPDAKSGEPFLPPPKL